MHHYQTLAAAKSDPRCNAISKLLLTAAMAMAMAVDKNFYSMAPTICGKILPFTIEYIAVARGFKGKMNL